MTKNSLLSIALVTIAVVQAEVTSNVTSKLKNLGGDNVKVGVAAAHYRCELECIKACLESDDKRFVECAGGALNCGCEEQVVTLLKAFIDEVERGAQAKLLLQERLTPMGFQFPNCDSDSLMNSCTIGYCVDGSQVE